MAAQTDLWGDLLTDEIRTPVSILREQASLLGTKTRNLVEATVNTMALPDGDLRHFFEIVVPSLDRYTYRLFWVQHPVAPLYPLLVSESRWIQSEQEFTEWLHKKLSSDDTKRIVASLLAQVTQ